MLADISLLRGGILLAMIVIVTVELWRKVKSIVKFRATINKIPGPAAPSGALFALGNIPSKVLRLMFSCDARQASEFYCSQVQSVLGHTLIHSDAPMYRLWLGQQPVICVWKPEVVESVLSDNTLLEKSYHYDYLRPWLGDGLLTSAGKIWRSRRKLLVPAFHFHILKDFVPVFDAKAKLLVRRLNSLIGDTHAQSHVLDVTPIITACALDAICETIMGVSINAQSNPKNDYCQSIYIVGEAFLERIIQPRYWLEPIFRLTELGKSYRHHLNKLHTFTRTVIAERKAAAVAAAASSTVNPTVEQGDSTGTCRAPVSVPAPAPVTSEASTNKPQAFLDLLLAHQNVETGKQQLSDEEIREEVDTFMFEGHDTTAMALSWCLFLLGHHVDKQQRLRDEIDHFFQAHAHQQQQHREGEFNTSEDDERPLLLEQIKTLKYLDCVIKEALRLCPSVPFIGRETKRDMHLHGYNIPAGSVLFVLIYQLHRDASIWSEPERFEPDRFARTDHARHPFAYVPFSAGPRNCIGQKFAMAEMKTILMYLVRHFYFESVTPMDKARPQMEMVLRPKSALNVRVTRRTTHLRTTMTN
ncbi:Cytochrome protein [Fragariocoptes setiger]|uniref:Cytochrome protein n=1 Tax=Fragariocoptes setiger TaxID=1670756 RepID=A0ABQ7S923_9ACAR|nr:Cytochrome protein [Fragariocoptes setiger]